MQVGGQQIGIEAKEHKLGNQQQVPVTIWQLYLPSQSHESA